MGLAQRAPAAGPAVLFTLGVWLAPRLAVLPVLSLVALVLLALAAGGRTARWLAPLAAGTLVAVVTWLPLRLEAAELAPHRPLALVGLTEGCWSSGSDEAGGWLHLRRVEQGRRVVRSTGRVRVHLPEGGAPPPCGSLVRLRGYLGGATTYHNVPEVRVGGWSLWLESPRLLQVLAPGGRLARAIGRWREAIAAGDTEPAPGRRLARALLLGDARSLPEEWLGGLRRVGLAHLVAVSGLHVGMVAGLAVALATPAPLAARRLVGLAAIALYALAVGPRPSLLRAGLMGLLVLGAPLSRRPPSPVNALAVALGLLMMEEPARVESLGLQLSVAATAGILLLARPPEGGRFRALRGAVRVTVAAQLATLPWALAAFHRIHPLAPLLNLAAVPWAAAALAAAAAEALARPVAPAVAMLLLRFLGLLAAPLEWLTALPPDPWWSTPAVLPWAGAVGVGIAACLAWWRFGARVLVAALALAIALAAAGARRPTAEVEVVVLDVGQGDAILLRDGPHAVLVDGGGWRVPGFGSRVLRPALAGLGVARLEALVVTHGDRDHCGGIVDLVREVPARVVWTGPLAADGSCARGLASGPVPARELVPGERRRVGRWDLLVLGPARGAGEAANSRSLILLAEAAGRRVLLPGDADAAAERALLAETDDGALAADLLKVAHHGSRSSSVAPFLAAVRPRVALISAGRDNRYGHPAPDVVARLRRQGLLLLRTDRHGRLRLRWRPAGPLRIEAVAGW